MTVATDCRQVMREVSKKTKKRILPIRKPVELRFKPDVSQQLMDLALDKAVSRYLSKK